jgi:hypothetical protein
MRGRRASAMPQRSNSLQQLPRRWARWNSRCCAPPARPRKRSFGGNVRPRRPGAHRDRHARAHQVAPAAGDHGWPAATSLSIASEPAPPRRRLRRPARASRHRPRRPTRTRRRRRSAGGRYGRGGARRPPVRPAPGASPSTKCPLERSTHGVHGILANAHAAGQAGAPTTSYRVLLWADGLHAGDFQRDIQLVAGQRSLGFQQLADGVAALGQDQRHARQFGQRHRGRGSGLLLRSAVPAGLTTPSGSSSTGVTSRAGCGSGLCSRPRSTRPVAIHSARWVDRPSTMARRALGSCAGNPRPAAASAAGPCSAAGR